MNYKRIGGIVALLIGVGLLIFGFYGTHRMKTARGRIDSASKLAPKSPVTGFIKENLYGRVDEYKAPVTLLYVGGALFVVIGGVLLYLGRKKIF